MGILEACLLLLRAMLIPKVHLALENLALRQQLAVFKQSVKRPKLRPRDRIFWILLLRLWPNWRSALAIVQPATVNGPGEFRHEHICTVVAGWKAFGRDRNAARSGLSFENWTNETRGPVGNASV